MADDSKAKLYLDIVQRTSQAVLLERMRRLGLWPADQGLPTLPTEQTAELARIEAELADLRRTQSKVKNPDKELAVERKRRWDESKKRRAANKAKKLAVAQERREAWHDFRRWNVVHAGAGVSAGLQPSESNADALAARDLPWLGTAADLATHLGIDIGRLRWLTFHRRGATLVHYRRYDIPKKGGGVRCISAPKPHLAAAQRWVLDNILAKLEVTAEAHGFVPGRSILTNAAPHAGRAVVANLDLRDFFPTVTFRRVKGLFAKIGYGEQVATVLALLCTEPPRVPVELDGKAYWVALSDRVLPQGACTSPAITNAICRRLDRRLAGLAKRHGFAFTRYADDLTFSGDDPRKVGRLLRSVRSVLEMEGFVEHPKKTKVMRRARRQEVTGLTVNTKPAVSRDEVRRLRAILHNAAKHGLASQNRENRPDFAAYLRGKVAFVAMVDPERGAELRAALERVARG